MGNEAEGGGGGERGGGEKKKKIQVVDRSDDTVYWNRTG